MNEPTANNAAQPDDPRRATASDQEDRNRQSRVLQQNTSSDVDEARTPRHVKKNIYGPTSADAAAHDLSPGRGQAGHAIGKYEFAHKIGEGGMGTVSLAFDRQLKRWVAIKRISGKYAGDERLQARLHAEAESIAKLSHFHIVQVFEKGVDGQGSFIAMEYIDGPHPHPGSKWSEEWPNPPFSLEDLIRQRGALNVDAVIKLGRKLCSALIYAHRQGVVHRDIKPSNILITHEGEPKVADFGLALQTDVDEARVTQVGVQLLTPGYGAPEQEQDSSNVDCRADIYALGATLYFAATGQEPRHFREDDIPRRLRAAISKAMRKDRERRLQTASDLERELKSAAQPAAQGTRLTCPNSRCRKSLLVSQRLAGRQVPCKACGALLRVATDLSSLDLADGDVASPPPLAPPIHAESTVDVPPSSHQPGSSSLYNTLQHVASPLRDMGSWGRDAEIMLITACGLAAISNASVMFLVGWSRRPLVGLHTVYVLLATVMSMRLLFNSVSNVPSKVLAALAASVLLIEWAQTGRGIQDLMFTIAHALPVAGALVVAWMTFLRVRRRSDDPVDAHRVYLAATLMFGLGALLCFCADSSSSIQFLKFLIFHAFNGLAVIVLGAVAAFVPRELLAASSATSTAGPIARRLVRRSRSRSVLLVSLAWFFFGALTGTLVLVLMEIWPKLSYWPRCVAWLYCVYSFSTLTATVAANMVLNMTSGMKVKSALMGLLPFALATTSGSLLMWCLMWCLIRGQRFSPFLISAVLRSGILLAAMSFVLPLFKNRDWSDARKNRRIMQLMCITLLLLVLVLTFTVS